VRHVEIEVLRNLERERLHVELAQRLREHAALAHARRVIAADEMHGDRGVDGTVEPHLEQVDVRDASPHLVELVLLEDRGVRVACAVDLDVEDGVQARLAGERAAKLAHLHGDRDRLGAPVEHAGDDALLAQAPRLA
jgi:hypothetical protein